MPSRSFSAALLLGATVLTFNTPAHAAQVVQSMFLVDGSLQPLSSFTLDRFDASLGTLTGVSFSLNWGGIGFYNISGTPNAGYRVLGSVTANITSSNSPFGIFAIGLPGTAGTLNSGGSASGFFDGIIRYSNAFPLSDLAGFVGTDPIQAAFTHSEQFAAFTSGGNGTVGLLLPSGQLSVTYDYIAAAVPSAVPEPLTWAMMAVGFAGVGAQLRRRKVMRVVPA